MSVPIQGLAERLQRMSSICVSDFLYNVRSTCSSLEQRGKEDIEDRQEPEGEMNRGEHDSDNFFHSRSLLIGHVR